MTDKFVTQTRWHRWIQRENIMQMYTDKYITSAKSATERRGRETDRQTQRQKDRQAGRQIHRQSVRDRDRERGVDR